jgi:hypothetical protein
MKFLHGGLRQRACKYVTCSGILKTSTGPVPSSGSILKHGKKSLLGFRSAECLKMQPGIIKRLESCICSRISFQQYFTHVV